MSCQNTVNDIPTKTIQPPLHQQHIQELYISTPDSPTNLLTNNVVNYHNPKPQHQKGETTSKTNRSPAFTLQRHHTPRPATYPPNTPCRNPKPLKHIYTRSFMYTLNPSLLLDPYTNTVVHQNTQHDHQSLHSHMVANRYQAHGPRRTSHPPTHHTHRYSNVAHSLQRTCIPNPHLGPSQPTFSRKIKQTSREGGIQNNPFPSKT